MTDGFGKYEVYSVAGSLYCYPESGVLRNRFGIRDGKLLRELEADISAARQTDMLANPIPGRFTAHHLRAIHRQLLGDVYLFAGRFRREDIAKGQTRFLVYVEIGDKLKALLAGLRGERYLTGLEPTAFLARSAYYFAELNYIHPFREGNGRAIREFMRLLAARSGYEVDWTAVPVDTLMDAMVASVFDASALEDVLRRCLSDEI